MSEKIEAVKSGGIVLKAIDSLSNNGYGWTSLDDIYKFTDNFFTGGLDTEYESGIPVRGLAHDLSLFEEIGWIGNNEGVVYLNDRGRKLLKKFVIPDYWKERFNKSLKLT